MILFLLTAKFDDYEFSALKELLEKAGFSTAIVGLAGDDKQGIFGRYGTTVKAELTVEEINDGEMTAMVIPNGLGPWRIIKDKQTLYRIFNLYNSKKIVAASGRAIKVLKAAGIEVDKPRKAKVQRINNIIIFSGGRNDISQFSDAITRAIHGKPPQLAIFDAHILHMKGWGFQKSSKERFCIDFAEGGELSVYLGDHIGESSFILCSMPITQLQFEVETEVITSGGGFIGGGFGLKGAAEGMLIAAALNELTTRRDEVTLFKIIYFSDDGSKRELIFLIPISGPELRSILSKDLPIWSDSFVEKIIDNIAREQVGESVAIDLYGQVDKMLKRGVLNEVQWEKIRNQLAKVTKPPKQNSLNSSHFVTSSTRIQQLKTLAELRASGALTEEEFKIEKARLLDLTHAKSQIEVRSHIVNVKIIRGKVYFKNYALVGASINVRVFEYDRNAGLFVPAWNANDALRAHDAQKKREQVMLSFDFSDSHYYGYAEIQETNKEKKFWRFYSDSPLQRGVPTSDMISDFIDAKDH